ncbi:phosphate ABC transporter ATP-binding protein [Marinobacter persicus]|jgi:phosphate transport system ATP-binding protein|uniref:Phosphate transport system ATP-binding protein n=1 Tax=Marinobacter persicus TaxID=930118 RepID=A0A2S6GA78_9GAMM|nr:phosphate ABC transporter ATP-binding protein [Marinobacter persicus]KXS53221.1 MAG: ABC transporter [Marinobacter sp. T13-3]PPK53342.1 phosphate transport system ATP-binding protein [Marinobacter persicus]PPK56179.1 phosphate transport system ATP-binding protein [Marinobacter persicus]PPK59774.1 phosphate transport system ATP-binding protein [Marinobacter persicus]
MSDTSAIRTENLNLFYGRDKTNQALKQVSVRFPANQLTTIIGPSGCGKSSLLKSLNRLHDLKLHARVEGEVYVGQDPIYRSREPVPDLRRRIGYVSQKPTALPMSIYRNVAYGPKIHGRPSRQELDELVERSLRKVNLWDEVKDRLNAPAADLSVGQIQRLSLARSLAVEPEVVLCDEVTSALDPISSERVEETLLALKQDYTIIMVTHLMPQVQRLADHVVFMYLGDALEQGPASEVLDAPSSERARDFIHGHGGGAKSPSGSVRLASSG